MNVWVFNQFAGSPHNSSGAGERYHFISKLLKKKGIDLTIFASSYNHLFIHQPVITGTFTVEYIDGVRYCWVKVPKYSAESAFGRLLSWMIFMIRLFFIPSTLVPKPDRIIVSSMSMFPIYPALWKRFFNSKLKVIFEIRDIWPLTLLEMGGFSKYNPVIVLMSITEKIAYRKAHHIISVLPFADRHIRSRVRKDIRFTWIPNGIDIDEFLKSESKSEVLNLLPKDKTIVTYAGAIGKANALEPFLEAHSKVSNPASCVFLILGTGPELERLRNMYKENRSIIFVGKIQKMDVHTILKKSDFLFIGWHKLPIYRFGVSANKYADYMLAKRPIISSGELEYDPVREAACGYVVASENAEAIAGAIDRLQALSTTERTRMGENGYQYLTKVNAMSVLSEKFFQVLNS